MLSDRSEIREEASEMSHEEGKDGAREMNHEKGKDGANADEEKSKEQDVIKS